MSLVIVPKTTQKIIHAFSEALDLKKVPKTEGKFWHGNFNDYFYEGLDGHVNVVFTGYSGAVAGQALFEYDSNYRSEDPRPEVYFVGSVYAFKYSDLEPGDLVYARDSLSPDSFEQSIYKNAEAKNLKGFTQPDQELRPRVRAQGPGQLHHAGTVLDRYQQGLAARHARGLETRNPARPRGRARRDRRRGALLRERCVALHDRGHPEDRRRCRVRELT